MSQSHLKKVSTHSEEGETPVDFVSTIDAVEKHYHQVFI